MRAWFGAVATAMGVVLAGAVIVVAQGGGSMNKPLEAFTIGDLFPKTDRGLKDTGAAWKGASDPVRAAAEAREKEIRAAMAPVKAAVDAAKSDAKSAEKAKDFEAAGAAQGRVRSGEAVLDLLKRLQTVASAQRDFGSAWATAGGRLQGLVDADDGFDRYRPAGIAKPGAGARDARLDKSGYDAFKNRAQALKDLGDAFSQLGSKIKTLGDSQLKFADELQKSGYIQK